MFIAAFVVFVIGAIIISATGGTLEGAAAFKAFQKTMMPPAILIAMLASGTTVFLMVRALAGKLIRVTGPTGVGWALGKPKHLFVAFILGVVLAILYVAIASAQFPVDSAKESGPLVRIAQTPGMARLLWAVLAIGFAPLFEEFLFRGVLFAGFARSWNVWVSSIVVTALFVLFHIGETYFFWPATISIGLMACLVLGLRIYTGCLGPAIAAHLAYNLVLVVLVYAQSFFTK